MKDKAEKEIEKDGRKSKKKLLVIILVLAVIFALGSLGGNKTPSGDTDTSPKEEIRYIKNYVGKNCASIGYTTVSGKRMDSYGGGAVDLIFVTEDGSFVDPEDEEVLKYYVVTEQSLAPDTELKLNFYKLGDGYSGLVESQSIEEIELKVKRIASDTASDEDVTDSTPGDKEEEATKPSEEEKPEEETPADSVDGMRPEFKAAMDSYEDFMNEYVDFMKKYSENSGDMSLLLDYADYMSKYSTFVKDFEAWDDDNMNAAETAYYIDVQSRVSKKLLEIA